MFNYYILSKNSSLKAIANIHNGSDTQTCLEYSLVELEAFLFLNLLKLLLST